MMLFFQILFVSLCIEKKKLHVKPFKILKKWKKLI